MPRRQVIVVIPVYRFPLREEEEMSVLHLRRFLDRFDLVIAAPDGLPIGHDYLSTLPIARFPEDCFRSIADYNRLMLSARFYERFAEYEYILIYQLDCLVFSRDLLDWCGRGWDYVGAPWFRGYRGDTTGGLWRTGNGGLSLRRVEKFLEVLSSRRPGKLPDEWQETRFLNSRPQLQEKFLRAKRWAYRRGYKNTIKYAVEAYQLNEDAFWSFEAQRFASNFVVAPPAEALGFAFEYAPRVCFQLAGEKLPFGCHAWHKIDPDFWKPFLLASENEELVRR